MNHGFQHLRRSNYARSKHAALVDQIFLDRRYFHSRNLHTEITSCDHDSVGDLTDFLYVIHTGTILNLGNNINVLSTILI